MALGWGESKAESRPPVLVPFGFRFNPTDAELLGHFLRKKLRGEAEALSVAGIIHDTNIYDFHPSELAGLFAPATEKDWYFFTTRERKHANGTRPNRATATGHWKASGSYVEISYRGMVLGKKRALVFFEGDSKNGIKTNWIMHEYVIEEFHSWVCCRIRFGRRPATTTLALEVD